jgi:hypothetical protein
MILFEFSLGQLVKRNPIQKQMVQNTLQTANKGENIDS